MDGHPCRACVASTSTPNGLQAVSRGGNTHQIKTMTKHPHVLRADGHGLEVADGSIFLARGRRDRGAAPLGQSLPGEGVGFKSGSPVTGMMGEKKGPDRSTPRRASAHHARCVVALFRARARAREGPAGIRRGSGKKMCAHPAGKPTRHRYPAHRKVVSITSTWLGQHLGAPSSSFGPDWFDTDSGWLTRGTRTTHTSTYYIERLVQPMELLSQAYGA